MIGLIRRATARDTLFRDAFLMIVVLLTHACASDPADRFAGRYELARCGELFSSGEYISTPIPCDVESAGSTHFVFVDSGAIVLGPTSQPTVAWDVHITTWVSGVPTRVHEVLTGTYALEGSTVRLELHPTTAERGQVPLQWDGDRRLTWQWPRKDALFER